MMYIRATVYNVYTVFLFAAGTDTSRFTLDWFLQLMALYPNIQDKLYEEIIANIGKDVVVQDYFFNVGNIFCMHCSYYLYLIMFISHT